VAAGTGHCAQGPVALAGVATITYSGSLMGPPVIAAEVAEEARARRGAVADRSGAAACRGGQLAACQDGRFPRRAADIAVPVRVLHGVLDDQCPIEHGRLLARQIPGAQLEEWRGGGPTRP
jgi:pimeloyl-ACP methyl ester carboxylesterase